jgi:hypothetical protein
VSYTIYKGHSYLDYLTHELDDFHNEDKVKKIEYCNSLGKRCESCVSDFCENNPKYKEEDSKELN